MSIAELASAQQQECRHSWIIPDPRRHRGGQARATSLDQRGSGAACRRTTLNQRFWWIKRLEFGSEERLVLK